MRKISTKTIAVCLSVLMLFSIVPVMSFAEDVFDGYTAITTAAELEAIKTNLAGNYYLANDIVMPADWTPIGWTDDSDEAFTGIFDGNNKTISSFFMNYDSGATYVGLFAINKGTIKNLVMDSANISGGSGVGLVAGVNKGLITNCAVNNSEVIGMVNNYSTTLRIGGITGQNGTGGVVSNCTVKDVYVSGNRFLGGVTGSNLGSVSDCTVTDVSINSAKSIDSIYRTGVANLVNYGVYIWSSIGGIAGNNQGDVTKCYVFGDVALYGFEYVGGFIGYNSGTASKLWLGTEFTDIPYYKSYTSGSYTVSPEAVKTTIGYNESGITAVKDIYTITNHATHSFGETTVITAAGCIDNGLGVHTCAVCGYTENVVIPACHTAGEWTVVTDATCTTKGSKELRCAVCNALISTADIETLPHTAGEWTVAQEATCTTKGVKEIRCTICDTLMETAEISELPHTAGQWTVAVEPTCTVAGLREIRCTVCSGLIDSQIIDATGHTAGQWTVAVEPTCTVAGSKETHCTVCGELIDSQIIDATGHTPGEWTVVQEATCTENGAKELRCTKCNELLDSESLASCGHRDENYGGICDDCGAKVNRTLADRFRYLFLRIKEIILSIIPVFSR